MHKGQKTMKRAEMIERAAEYLKSKGYFIAQLSPVRGIDLIMFGEDKNKPILVFVGDATKRRFIPMNGFGYSKQDKEMAERFAEAARRWTEAYCPLKAEYDTVWVSDTCLSHCTNINVFL